MDSEKTVIDLLRHGDTGRDGFRGSLDDPLTDLGREQMRVALRNKGPWHAVICSPLIRCAEFATEVGCLHGIPVHTDLQLKEFHFGQWEGRTPGELMEIQPRELIRFWSDPYANPPPQGERLRLFEVRVMDAWRNISRRFTGRSVLVITHGGVIRLILCHLRGLSRGSLLQIDVPHASLYRVSVDGLCASEIDA